MHTGEKISPDRKNGHCCSYVWSKFSLLLSYKDISLCPCLCLQNTGRNTYVLALQVKVLSAYCTWYEQDFPFTSNASAQLLLTVRIPST